MNEVGFHQIHLIENYCKSDQLIKTVSEGSNDRVYEYLDDVGADPAIKDYCRNTPYYELLELEFSPDVISTIARHKDLATTSRYIAVNDDQWRVAINMV
jgi:hypothetical protein